MSDVLNAVMAQYDTNTKPTKKKTNESNEERLKKYFSTNLSKNKETGTKVFRILPPKNGKSPFTEVWCHEIKIGDNWVKLYCPKKNKGGDGNCPLCDVEKSLLDSGTKDDKEIASQYRARKFYVVKGIDRDCEADGPKFWRFRHNFKKQGILDKIVPVFSTKGDVTNVDKGRDLILTLGKDDNGYTKITSIMPEDPGPLSEDAELSKLWVEDDTTWEDVYSKKSFEYLDIVAQGEIPYWDKDTERYITKTEYEAKSNNGVTVETMNDDGETTATIGGKKDTSKTETPAKVENKSPEKPIDKTPSKPAAKAPVKPAAKAPVKPVVEEAAEDGDDSDVEMDDLPF